MIIERSCQENEIGVSVYVVPLSDRVEKAMMCEQQFLLALSRRRFQSYFL
jgi:hypothetical protein